MRVSRPLSSVFSPVRTSPLQGQRIVASPRFVGNRCALFFKDAVKHLRGQRYSVSLVPGEIPSIPERSKMWARCNSVCYELFRFFHIGRGKDSDHLAFRIYLSPNPMDPMDVSVVISVFPVFRKKICKDAKTLKRVPENLKRESEIMESYLNGHFGELFAEQGLFKSSAQSGQPGMSVSLALGSPAVALANFFKVVSALEQVAGDYGTRAQIFATSDVAVS